MVFLGTRYIIKTSDEKTVLMQLHIVW